MNRRDLEDARLTDYGTTADIDRAIERDVAVSDGRSSKYPPPEEDSYVCAGCRRRVPKSFGAADDMPDHCDDCWAAAHPAPVVRDAVDDFDLSKLKRVGSWAGKIDEERARVKELGERFGFGRVMQLCEELWGEYLVQGGVSAGGARSVGPCVGSLVPCPCTEDGKAPHCDWCCAGGRVTERVRRAMYERRRK